MNAKGSDNFLQAMIFKFEGGWSHVWCKILLESNELSSILPTLTIDIRNAVFKNLNPK